MELEADLSYNGAEGLCRAIIESYENEITVNRLMNEYDRKEAKLLSESASDEIIHSFQEEAEDGILDYIIDIMKRFYAKIKGIIIHFIHKVEMWYSKVQVSKYKKILKKSNIDMDRLASITIEDWCEPKKYSNKGLQLSTIHLDKLSDDMDKILEKIFSQSKNWFVHKTSKSKDGKTIKTNKLSFSEVNTDDTDMRDIIVKILFDDREAQYSDILSSEYYHSKCYKESNSKSAKSVWPIVVNIIDSGNETIDDIEKQIKEAEKYSKSICALAKLYKKKDKKISLTELNKVIRVCNNLYFIITNLIFKELVFGLNQTFRVLKFVTKELLIEE